MPVEKVTTIHSTADLLGIQGVLVEGRMPTLGEPEWEHFRRRGGSSVEAAYGYAARDGTEVMSPTARNVLVPHPVDPEFLAYMRDMFHVLPQLHEVYLPQFTAKTVEGIMDRYKGAGDPVYYGWWAIDGLPSHYQLLLPEAQRWGNQKTSLRKIYAGWEDVLAGQIILRDPRVLANATDGRDARTIFDLTQNDLYNMQNGTGRTWIKAAKWGLAGQGVMEGQTIGDIVEFYYRLVDLGVKDASIILEEDLPGEGGSFTLIRRVDGKVLFNHVTKQLNVGGKRVGNIIHDIGVASPQMKDLIDVTAERLGDPTVVYPDKPGVYAFDTIEDASGRPKSNDVANRTTGTWNAATHRIHLINALNLPPRDTVTMTDKMYIPPGCSFSVYMKALEGLTDWRNNSIVTVRQYYNGHGMTCVYLALTTTDQQMLPALQGDVRAALDRADIRHSSSPLK